MIELFKKTVNCLISLGNNKLRVLNFGYVVAVNMSIMSFNFLRNLLVSLKVMAKLFNIAPIELKLAVCT